VSADNGIELVLRESCATGSCREFSLVNSDTLSFGRNLQVGQQFSLDILIKNPSRLPVYSVSSWISYDPNILNATNLSDEQSAFSLAAPSEFQISQTEGLVKIGRASLGQPITTEEILVARVTFSVLKNPNNANISFHDFQGNDLGHTAVLTVDNIITKNLLEKAPKKLLFSSVVVSPTKSPPLQTAIPVFTTPMPSGSVVTIPSTTPINTPVSMVEIPRPEGFRARTKADGGVEILWKFGEDTRIEGYYVYYDEKSGLYIHRKDVGRANVFSFPAGTFERGKRIFFAIKAYGSGGMLLSDFSDEASLVIGTVGSESHPFYEDILQKLGVTDPSNSQLQSTPTNFTAPKTPNAPINPQTGSSQTFFFLLIFIGGGMIIVAFRMIQTKRKDLFLDFFQKN
jgi:hypothetical protein